MNAKTVVVGQPVETARSSAPKPQPSYQVDQPYQPEPEPEFQPEPEDERPLFGQFGGDAFSRALDDALSDPSPRSKNKLSIL